MKELVKNKYVQIGAGVTVLILLIWLLFIRKNKTGKTVLHFRGTEPNERNTSATVIDPLKEAVAESVKPTDTADIAAQKEKDAEKLATQIKVAQSVVSSATATPAPPVNEEPQEGETLFTVWNNSTQGTVTKVG